VKRYGERIFVYLSKFSGYFTSVVLLLIVLVFFKEAFNLFRTPIIDDTSVLIVHSSNPIRTLDSKQINAIFSNEIDSWDELGGDELEIIKLNYDKLGFEDSSAGSSVALKNKVVDLVRNCKGVILIMPKALLPYELKSNVLQLTTYDLMSCLSGTIWDPTLFPSAQYGFWPLILGTLLLALLSVCIAMPLSLIVGLYISAISSPNQKLLVVSFIELIATIPSVVYGFVGLVVVVPFLQFYFEPSAVITGVTAILILAFMILPTLILSTYKAIDSVSYSFKEGAYALGVSEWQMLIKVILPASFVGILSGSLMGLVRAIGETMIVLVLVGNAKIMPVKLIQSVPNIHSSIALELNHVLVGSSHYYALFALGAVLLVLSIVITIVVEMLNRKSYS
jgi:phosphate transport system permease protein